MCLRRPLHVCCSLPGTWSPCVVAFVQPMHIVFLSVGSLVDEVGGEGVLDDAQALCQAGS